MYKSWLLKLDYLWLRRGSIEKTLLAELCCYEYFNFLRSDISYLGSFSPSFLIQNAFCLFVRCLKNTLSIFNIICVELTATFLISVTLICMLYDETFKAFNLIEIILSEYSILYRSLMNFGLNFFREVLFLKTQKKEVWQK